MISLALSGDNPGIGIEEGKECRDALERIIWGGAIPDVWSANPKTSPQAFRRALSSAAPEEDRHIEAICRGAVLDPRDLFPIYAGEVGVTFGFCPPVTSLIAAVSPGRFEGGDLCVGVNVDVPIFLGPFVVARTYRPTDSYARVEVSLITVAGALFGINERGLAAALSLKPFEGDGGGLVPLSLSIRQALKSCKDAKGAVKLIGSFPRGASGTIVLADPSSIVVVELTPRTVSAMEVTKGLFVSSGYFLLPDMMSLDLPHLTVYPETAPSELIGKRVYETSEKRVDRAFDLIDSHERWDTMRFAGVLSNREDDVCLSSGFYKTAVSAVMVPAEKALFMTTARKGRLDKMSP
jgi:hypothetical protein